MMNRSVLAAAMLLAFSSASFAGVTFTQITTVDGKRTTVAKVSSDGSSAKMEFVESPDNSLMPRGSYMLFADGEMLLVNPTQRTYARFDNSMMEGVAGMAGAMQITDIKFEKVVDEAGPSIEGYPTRHYQFKSSWSMGMQGMPMKTEQSTVEDLWTTTAIAGMRNIPAAPSSTAMPAQVTAVAETQGLRNVEGVPLKHVTVQTSKTDMGGFGALGALGGLGGRLAGGLGGGGRGGRGGRGGGGDDAAGDAGGGFGGGFGGGNSTTTVELVDIKEVDVPAAAFELPSGYSETSLFQTGPAIPSLNGVQETPPAVPSLNDLN
jgi:hypothetical protein